MKDKRLSLLIEEFEDAGIPREKLYKALKDYYKTDKAFELSKVRKYLEKRFNYSRIKSENEVIWYEEEQRLKLRISG